MTSATKGLAFLGPDTPLMSAYGEACLVAKTNFPVLTLVTATFYTFMLGVAVGVLIMLRYPMFNRTTRPPSTSDQHDGGNETTSTVAVR
jgi:hypothetical protein